VVIQQVEEAEVDEMWSYVGKKREPRWLWHAIDHRSGHVLAYVLGRRKDEVFLKLKGLLEPFGITKYYTDYWGAYTRHLDADAHQPGKRNTQQIERKHLTLRTRIKRWCTCSLLLIQQPAKTCKIPSLQHVYEGVLPWCLICSSTSSC